MVEELAVSSHGYIKSVYHFHHFAIFWVALFPRTFQSFKKKKSSYVVQKGAVPGVLYLLRTCS